MTKDEALDLALDALDNLLYWDNGKSDYDQAREAITAIKQARSAPVQPVANIRTWHKNGEQHAELWNWDKGIEVLPDGEHNLYTTSPAAPVQEPVAWKDLTDEDFENAFQETYIMGDSDLKDFAKVIEAKLKEKNT